MYLGNFPVSGDNSFRILDDITSYTLTFDGSSSSVVSTTNYTITQINHRFVTAQRVTYTHGGGTAIGGLTSGTAYFIIKVDQNTIKLATSAVNANNNAPIDLNALGTGTSHTLNVAFDDVNTKFKATYNNGTKAELTRAAQLQISINGVIQQPQDSIAPVNGFGLENDSTIVFSTAPSSTDVFWGNVIANSYPTFDVSDNTVDTFTGTGSQTNFSLSKTPANNQNVLVTINGVVQYPSDATTSRSYSVDANVLTFTSAPAGGSIIQVRHIGFAGATSSAVTGFYGRTGNVGLTTADNVVIGTATIGVGAAGTTLLVQGNARITGILSIGQGTVTIDGDGGTITGISNLAAPSITGVATFSTGPVLIGTGSSTGTASQTLQAIGGGYVSGNLGVGVTNPSFIHTSYGGLSVNSSDGAIIKLSNSTTGSTGSDGFDLIVGAGSNIAYVWQRENSDLVFGTNTIERVRINSGGALLVGSGTSTGTASQPLQVTGGAYVSGNLGVGVTNPGSSLTVKGSAIRYITTADLNTGIYLSASGSDRPHVSFRVSDNSERGKLEINGINGASGDRLGLYSFYSGNLNEVISIFGGGSVCINNTALTGTASQTLQVTGGAYVSGFVGIGTTNPQASLHLIGTGAQVRWDNGVANDARHEYYRAGVRQGYINWDANIVTLAATQSSGVLTFATGGTTERVRIDSSGNLGINTTSVSAKLQVHSNITTAYANISPTLSNVTNAWVNSSPHVSGGTFVGAQYNLPGDGQNRIAYIGAISESASDRKSSLVFGTDEGGNRTEKVRITGDGNVGIATINPQAPLHVVGSGTTALLVSGNARITGILTVGTSSLTFDGNANTITGLSTITGSSNFSKPNLSGISSTITATAVDVFVYDTRKDSDGGAWRKRTQHTSWYNETLNTATRGSRKDFPAVAVIVATTNTITIYDGDDPDMPIWMKFTDGFNTYLGMGIGGLTSVAMLNGVMVHGGQYDVHVTNFISDKTNRYGDSGITVNHTQPISGRNNDTAGNYNGPTTPVIANRQVNDVAMTVLPNAPIDSTTGLPVPTIAVATQGGTSIIKDDGTVINGGDTAAIRYIHITNENRLYYTFTSFNQTREVSLPTSWTSSGFAGNYQLLTNSFPALTSNAGTSIKTSKESYGTADGIVFHNPDPVNFPSISTATNGMVAYATTTYNTGWMHGNIKGAFLSDTSTTSVTGTELVTNGDFSTSTLTSYGQLYNCSLSVVSNQLRVTSTAASGYAEFYVGISDTTKYHYFSFQFVGASGITQFGIYAGSTGYITDTNAGWTNPSYTASRSAGIYTLLIPPGNSIVGFVFALNSLGQTWTFDNISLKPVQELDRSVNNRGLAVYGTITKTAVATGADLVAYSGFSLSNYLVQPYNSVLVAGTGSQCFMGWVYTAGLDTNLRYLFSVGRQDSNEQFRLGFSSSAAYFDYGNGSQYIQWSGNKIPSNSWTFVVAMVTAGQAGRVFVNGIELTSPSYSVASPSTFSTDSTFVTTIGTTHENHYGGGSTNAVWNGSISLVRFGLSLPSLDQIKKIYNDEKALFQENSKATLYGTSSAVTALAYDDSTRLLYAGTSSGRSDFQGLERINNTTTAVTTAISASNGLVAEQ